MHVQTDVRTVWCMCMYKQAPRPDKKRKKATNVQCSNNMTSCAGRHEHHHWPCITRVKLIIPSRHRSWHAAPWICTIRLVFYKLRRWVRIPFRRTIRIVRRLHVRRVSHHGRRGRSRGYLRWRAGIKLMRRGWRGVNMGLRRNKGWRGGTRAQRRRPRCVCLAVCGESRLDRHGSIGPADLDP